MLRFFGFLPICFQNKSGNFLQVPDPYGSLAENLTKNPPEIMSKVHSILQDSSNVGVLPAALKAGASPPIPLTLSCHWDGGGVGTIEDVSKG